MLILLDLSQSIIFQYDQAFFIEAIFPRYQSIGTQFKYLFQNYIITPKTLVKRVTIFKPINKFPIWHVSTPIPYNSDTNIIQQQDKIIIIMYKIYKNIYNYLKPRMQAEQTLNLCIKLTKEQQKIFGMLKKYRNELGLKTVLRVAGGWVRDKVIGKQSKDIDIALDDIKGEQFVTMIKKCAENGDGKISGFGVTKFNPELSKHLETATAKIDDLWIDFVNLRCEQYSGDSRIPVIKFGTPLQDAERRDFTINSLFYNIDAAVVEDCTGKGLDDLKNQIIRTPLDPSITFKDDPLRILRCLRFKSRFDFKVDPKIYDAIKMPQIQEALQKKVSKQRVGIELAGLLKAKHFTTGLQDIKDYGLWNIVFQIPQDCQLYSNKQLIKKIPDISYKTTDIFINSLDANQFMTYKQLISQSQSQQQQNPKLKKSKKIQYEASQLQFLLLLSSLTYIYHNYQVKVGKTKSNLVSYMIKDQLKYSAKCAKFATHFAEVVKKLENIQSNQNVFEIIRWLRFAEEKWEVCIHFYFAFCQVAQTKPNIDLFGLRKFIVSKNIGNSYLVESPVDGSFITKKGVKGPAISKILQNAAIWRILNPDQPRQAFQKLFTQNPQFFSSENTYK